VNEQDLHSSAGEKGNFELRLTFLS